MSAEATTDATGTEPVRAAVLPALAPGEASDCPPDRTFARLIDGTLGDDRVRKLQAHCDGCPRCARTLAELARTIAPDEGDWLGERYRLLEPLGAGGMGVVYTALDMKLQRRVAIKRLREVGGAGSGLATRRAKAAAPPQPIAGGAEPSQGSALIRERRRGRFLREAQLLASLSHPNVLTVHDVGGIDHDLYVVMELVDGWPMSQWISETRPRPGWREIVDQYLQAGRGLSAAHKLDVVHRDVKPENILVARSGRVLIGDFGLAGLRDATETAGEIAAAGASTGAALTQTGAVLGTPAYMAPELHDGKASGALSDQFSFCVSLYESLHGRRPFTGQTAAEIAAAVRGGRLPLGRDGVPRAVDRVLAAGLAADPRRRHSSMDALLADLARARNRPSLQGPLVAAAVAALLAVAVGAAMLRPARRPAFVLEATATREAPSPGEPAAAPEEIPSEATPIAPAGATAPTLKPPARKRWTRAGQQANDPVRLLYQADSAHGDRDGAACIAALEQLPGGRWPAALADHALRRRATCEMLRGSCEKGRRLLVPLDGANGARGALLDNCPAGLLPTIDDRILAVAAQADEARYTGNEPARRRELQQTLLRQTAAPEIQDCMRNRTVRGCGRRLAILARSYQVVAEAFLAGGDCTEGAALDVMQNQLKRQSLEPEESDPVLGCRAERTVDIYKSCAAAAAEAERRCVARLRAAPREP